jgi:hypothetical protein
MVDTQKQCLHNNSPQWITLRQAGQAGQAGRAGD